MLHTITTVGLFFFGAVFIFYTFYEMGLLRGKPRYTWTCTECSDDSMEVWFESNSDEALAKLRRGHMYEKHSM